MIITVLPMRMRLVASQSSGCNSSLLAGTTVHQTAAIHATTTITRARTSRSTPTRPSIPHTIPVVAVPSAREADIPTAAGLDEGAGAGGGVVRTAEVPASTTTSETEAETSMQVARMSLVASEAAARAARPAAFETGIWRRTDGARVLTVPRGVRLTRTASETQGNRMDPGPTRTMLAA